MPDETERVTRVAKQVASEMQKKPVSLGGATNVSLSISTLIAVAWAVWWGANNLVLADDLTDYVKQSEAAEMKKSLNRLERLAIRSAMRDLSKEIAVLRHKHDTDLGNWTASDASSLADMESELAELKGELDES